MATSEALGVEREVVVPGAGTIRYRERGEGRPVVFVHGLLVNADLWRAVVPAVAEAGLRCLSPDWPLGSHELAVPGADLSPPGVAALVAGFLEQLDLHDVTVVANDTGGAITQILMANAPERIGGVVLTPSDALSRFFPPMFAYLPVFARVPGSMWLLTGLLRVRALHRLPITFGWLSKRPVPEAVVDGYLRSSRQDPAIRADLRRFLRGVHRRHTLAAGEAFPRFAKPVLLAWAEQDRVFPIELAHRLARLLPDARVEPIPDSYTFVPEDQPERLAELVVEFAHSRAARNDSRRRSQQERSTTTRAALVAAGRSLFAEHGYATVSTEQVAGAAGVTRGAMYHHHRDKRDLFRAVVEDLEAEVTAQLRAIVERAPSPRIAMLTTLGGYLDHCQRPDVARILLIDAPGVLGWQEWREIETRHGLGIVITLLEAADLTDPALTVLAQLAFSAAIEAALIIAHADDPRAARIEAEAALLTLFARLLPAE